MLDIKSHSQLAEAGADMMLACALVATLTASAPLFRGMSFWLRMMRASAANPAPVFQAPWSVPSRLSWTPIQGWAAWSRACMPEPKVPTEPAPAAAEPLPSDPAFSSYRSSGGHAAAQVIVA